MASRAWMYGSEIDWNVDMQICFQNDSQETRNVDIQVRRDFRENAKSKSEDVGKNKKRSQPYVDWPRGVPHAEHAK